MIREGKFRVYKNLKDDVGFVQHMTLKIDDFNLNLANVHGKTHPGDKYDTPIRIKQSARIINFFEQMQGLTIIGGDFNLLPNTKSVSMFEEKGYVDLIKRFKIKSTRNRIAWENFKHQPGFVKQHYADYCFVSKDVKVKKFTVPNIEVSGHLPLILEFEV